MLFGKKVDIDCPFPRSCLGREPQNTHRTPTIFGVSVPESFSSLYLFSFSRRPLPLSITLDFFSPCKTYTSSNLARTKQWRALRFFSSSGWERRMSLKRTGTDGSSVSFRGILFTGFRFDDDGDVGILEVIIGFSLSILPVLELRSQIFVGSTSNDDINPFPSAIFRFLRCLLSKSFLERLIRSVDSPKLCTSNVVGMLFR
mmetsp:Transcript_12163/g.25090  ORF Transcript_12163/g.25090 Transcript_12163/m.25090 type:complete len:201 (-) Transcript_12163:237-839(-)